MKAKLKIRVQTKRFLLKTILIYLVVLLSNFSLLSQNVGIGTTNPTEKLTVDGTVRVERNSSASAPQMQLHETEYDYTRLKFSNDNTLSYFSLAGRPADDLGAARFNLYNSDSGNILTATGSGRLGVNVTPAASLHVDAISGTDPLRIQNSNSTKFRIFSNNAMSFGHKWDEAIPGVFWMNTPNLFIGFNKDHIPEERLEVDGDVRITGGIVANTVSGTPGQILTTGNDGNIAWSSPCSYNRFYGFPQAGSVPWTVPAGVTEIMVELWGAGGGGHNGGGGGSGGYVKTIFEVIPGDVLTVVTGSGGQGEINAIQAASDGGPSTITGTNVFAAVLGGKKAAGNAPGAGGTYSVILPYLSATAQIGETGHYNVTIPIYAGTDKKLHGRGGQSPNAARNYGLGDTIIDSGGIDYNRGTSGISPGGGGGGGSNFGHSGGDGYVIIRWN
jgi:hypothetical protein